MQSNEQSTSSPNMASAEANMPAEGFEILIADDSPIDRKLLERALSGGRYAVLVAKSGQEAMDLFAKHRPSLVVTDWMMPDLTGIELCKRIRGEFEESYTYIIILTGMTETNEVVKGLAAGADDYLTKPFHADELVARVEVGRRIVGLQRQLETKNRLLEELALTDALTGLPNRRAVESWAIRELNAAARHDFPFWVVMADLDNFKSVNDKYGHKAGDTVLKGFAEILKSGTRSSDICGRIGGEEFLIVLSHTQQAGARLAIERIRERFASQSFFFGGHQINVTASFGIAGHSRHQSQNFVQLMTQADTALYSAKRLGRNRIEIAVTEINSAPDRSQGCASAQTWPQTERRRHWRYPCAGEALIRAMGGDISLPGRLSNISLGGCYVDVTNPFPSGTHVEVTVSLGGRVAQVRGWVRDSRQGFGMGIAFTEIAATDPAKLLELLKWLADSFPQEHGQDVQYLARVDVENSFEQTSAKL